MAGLELASVIADLRDELVTAITTAEGTNPRIRFELGPIQVALKVTVTKEGGGGLKAKFWVLEAGAEGKVSNAATQEITLVLNPKDTHAPDQPAELLTTPLVTGESMDNEK